MSDILNKTIVLVLNRNWQAINIRTPADAFCRLATNAATTLDIEVEDAVERDSIRPPHSGIRTSAIRPLPWDGWITLPVRAGDHAVCTARGVIRVPTVIVAVNFVLGGGGISRLHIAQPKKPINIRAIRTSMNTLNPRNPMRLLLAALSCSVGLTARAQDFADPETFFATPMAQTQQFAITPFYGFRFGGEVEDLNTGTSYSFDDGPAYGLCLSYAPPEYLGRFELLWSHQDSGINFKGNYGLNDVDLTIDVIQIGGVSEFGTERFREYVSGHIGATHYSADGFGTDTRFSFGIGAGVKAFITKNLYLCADIRGFCTVTDAEGGFIYYNGITVASFSGETMWQGQVSLGLGLTF